MRYRLGLVLAVIGVSAVAVLACGSGGGSSGQIGTITFAKVCNGEGVEDAAFYGSAADGEGPFPVAAFRRPSADSGWYPLRKHDLGADFPDEWLPGQAAQTEMVVCLTAVERELANTCYYTAASDEEGGEVELVVELYNTTYEAVLREARTAEEFASTTFLAETAGICEEYTLETIPQDVRRIDAEPGTGLVSFLDPWTVKK